MKEAVKRFWCGEEPLWRAFWLWGIGGNMLCILIIIGFASRYNYTNNYTVECVGIICKSSNLLNSITKFSLTRLAPIYAIFGYAGILRCAGRNHSDGKYVAAIVISLLLMPLILYYLLLAVGALREI